MGGAAGRGRLESIDALRGLAALAVVAFHMSLIPTPRPAVPGWARPAVEAGSSGVTLFFLISGFTMALTATRRAEPRPVASFYLRRFFRIAPLYYCWLAFMIARGGYLPGKPRLLELVAFAYNPDPALQEGLVWASWTLGVEMVFYAGFPWVYRHVAGLARSLAACGAALGVAGLSWWGMARAGLPFEYRLHSLSTQLPLFLLGIACFHASALGIVQDRRRGLTMIAAGLAMLVGVAYGRPAIPAWLHPTAPAYILILLGLRAAPVGIVANRATAWVGTISFSLYLNHPMLIFGLSGVGLYARIDALPIMAGARFALCFAATLALLIPVSWATYEAVERPANRLGAIAVGHLRRATAD